MVRRAPWTRRQALSALLAGLGTAALHGCKPAPEEEEEIPTGGVAKGRMDKALGTIFAGTPWEDQARMLPGMLQADADALRAKGMESSAELLEKTANVVLLGLYEATAALKTSDPEVDPQPFGEAAGQGLIDFVLAKEELAELASSSAAELLAANGDQDAVSAADQEEASDYLVEQDGVTRKWMHQEGLSGEGYANTVLRTNQTERARCLEPRSIAATTDSVAETARSWGSFDTDLEVLAGLDPQAPPPVELQDACAAMGVLGILVAPFALGGGLAGAADETAELIELAMYAFGTGASVADMVADGAAGDHPCDTLYLMIQLIMQGLAFLLSIIALACLFGAFAGVSLLMGLFLAFQGGMAVAGAVCAFDKAINLMADWKVTCGS